ncbi:unnamed protein product [Porites evermanni]|uniref:Uncharacterized protein n=1 Tax=Porites evermanni TaxID=104178 RepID=A0ABN8SQD2_9CNID|nr:unnamed protein product [Porites evermanni]
MPNGERISRYIKKKSCYQAVYDWVRYLDGQPLFFTLHGGGGVKKLSKPIEGYCFLHLVSVSLRESLPKGTEDLSSTLPEEGKKEEEGKECIPGFGDFITITVKLTNQKFLRNVNVLR